MKGQRASTWRGRSQPTRFGAMLRLYRTVNQQALREVAKETGISHATLMRIEHGEAFDVATLLKLAHWLTAPPSQEKEP